MHKRGGLHHNSMSFALLMSKAWLNRPFVSLVERKSGHVVPPQSISISPYLQHYPIQTKANTLCLELGPFPMTLTMSSIPRPNQPLIDRQFRSYQTGFTIAALDNQQNLVSTPPRRSADGIIVNQQLVYFLTKVSAKTVTMMKAADQVSGVFSPCHLPRSQSFPLNLAPTQ